MKLLKNKARSLLVLKDKVGCRGAIAAKRWRSSQLKPYLRSRVAWVKAKYFLAIFGCLLASLTILPSTLHAQAAQDAGYVLSLEGTWLVGKSQRLKPFDKLRSGARIRAGKPIGKRSYINIALFRGDTIRRACQELKNCASPIDVPSATKRADVSEISSGVGASGLASAAPATAPSLTQRIGQAFWSLFHHREKYRVPTLVRDGSKDLREAVIAKGAGDVDLAPVFADLPAGTYYLEAENLSLDQASQVSPSLAITVEWDSERALASLDKLQVGLYRLRGRGRLQCWILLVTPQQYQMANQSFQEAVQYTKKWSRPEESATVRAFLRAFLNDRASDLGLMPTQGP